jgi:hypothetical protein
VARVRAANGTAMKSSHKKMPNWNSETSRALERGEHFKDTHQLEKENNQVNEHISIYTNTKPAKRKDLISWHSNEVFGETKEM